MSACVGDDRTTAAHKTMILPTFISDKRLIWVIHIDNVDI